MSTLFASCWRHGRCKTVRYWKDDQGRNAGMTAMLDKDNIGGGTKPDVSVPGFDSSLGHNRGHLLAAFLGGSNVDPRNFVTMFSRANSPVMRGYELQVSKAVKGGETVRYTVVAHYDGVSKIPSALTLHAIGSGPNPLLINVRIPNVP